MGSDILAELLAKIDEARDRTDKLGAQAEALGVANFAGRLDHIGCLLAEAAVTVCELRRQRADAMRRVGLPTVAELLNRSDHPALQLRPTKSKRKGARRG